MNDQGNSGIGMSKHRKSGKTFKSRRMKMAIEREANKLVNKPVKNKMFGSFKALFDSKPLALVLMALSVWTYGSQALDILVPQNEAQRFLEALECEVRAEQVWCKVGSEWETIDNKQLPIPWGVD